MLLSLLLLMLALPIKVEAQSAVMENESDMEFDGVSSDELMRGKCKNYCRVNTQTLCAGCINANSVCTCSAQVKGNAQINGNITIGGAVVGDLRVEGSIIPRQINVPVGASLNTVLNNLADCTQNNNPHILNLPAGTYNVGDLNVTKQLPAVTLQGDTNPLAGVAFMEGGMNRFPGLNVQFQIFENTAIGNGCNYHLILDSATQVSVTADNDALPGGLCIANPGPAANNPDFSGLVIGTSISFVGDDGDIYGPFTVASVSGNQITFNQDVSGVSGLGDPSNPGVGFAIHPNVTLVGGAANRVVGIKELKVRGVFLDWSAATDVKNQPGLFLGGVKTKLELSNCMGRGVIRITARESYNCQPNTFMGITGLDPGFGSAVVFLPPSEPNFLYNSVFGNNAQVIADTSKAGVFNFTQYSAAWLQVVDLARLSICFSRFYNVSGRPAVFVTDRSRIRWPGGVSYNCEVGARLQNSSAMATTNPNGDQAALAIINCDTGLVIEKQSQAFIVDTNNGTSGQFSGNTTDLLIDGASFADIDNYTSCSFIDAPSGLISYAMTTQAP